MLKAIIALLVLYHCLLLTGKWCLLQPKKKPKGKGKAPAAKGKTAVQSVAKMSPTTRAAYKAALEQYEEDEE